MIRRRAVLALVLAGPLFALAPWRARAEGGVVAVEPAELERLLRAGVPLVDIRRPDEWRETGVIAGSRWITLFDARGAVNPAFMEEFARVARPDRPVALICRTGNRSDVAARMLVERMGYARVYDARGGITRWIAEGRPVGAPGGAGR